MLSYYYINKEWMISATARRVYRVAAYLSLALFLLLIFLRSAHAPENIFPLLRFLLLVGVVGAATTFVGMEYFLFGFDTSAAINKVFWFCVLMVPLLGPALYCFFVYSRSKVIQGPERQKKLGKDSMAAKAERYIVVLALVSGFIILALLTAGTIVLLYTGKFGWREARGLFLIATIVILIMRELWKRERPRQ
jgi:hypothetical protein